MSRTGRTERQRSSRFGLGPVLRAVGAWWRDGNQVRELRDMTPRMLDDVGLTRRKAEALVRRMGFWARVRRALRNGTDQACLSMLR